MKTIRIIRRWIKGAQLSNKDKHYLDELWMSIKIGFITIAVVVATIVLANQAGCFSGRITQEDLQESRP